MPRRAVIDVGSNSVLLVVAERDGGLWRPLLETSEVSGLGEGLSPTGNLTEQAMQRTLGALLRGFAAARSHGVEPKAFGTMALRAAHNSGDFLSRASAQGTPVEVIPGDLEAQLGLASLVGDPRFEEADRITLIDVGGLSTEVAIGARASPGLEDAADVFLHSFSIGTLGLRAGNLAAESPTPGALLRASEEIDEAFGKRLPDEESGLVVAVGATATNLVTVRGALTEWDPDRVHGAHLEFEEVSGFVGRLARLSDAGRAALPGLEKGRERTIHIGALILERALHAVHAESCRVSVRGWRHAILGREECWR